MNEFLTHALPPFAAWLADLALQSTVLLLLALAAAACFRQPAQRVVVAWSALVGLALLTAVSLAPLWPRMNLMEPVRVQAAGAAADHYNLSPIQILPQTPPPDIAVVEQAAPRKAPQEIALAAPQGHMLRLWPDGVVYAWLATALVACLWILFGSWQVRRVLRLATLAPEWTQVELKQIVGGRRPPQLKTTQHLSAAAAAGAWRPSILLPEVHVSLENRAGVQAALRHEWAHIRHGDLWLLALERLLLPLYAWQPLFWLLRRQLRLDQELLADAAAAGDQPVEYAEALLEWARLAGQSSPPAGLAALAMFENPRTLSRRIEMVLNSQPVALHASWLGRWSVVLTLLVIALSLSLVTLRPRWILAEDPPILAQPRPTNRPAAKTLGPLPPAVNDEVEVVVAEAQQIRVKCVLFQVDHAKLETVSNVSLGEIIQKATDSKCTLEGDVVVATFDAKKAAKLDTVLGGLRNSQVVEVLSRPQIITLDGQEATVQVGQEVVIAEVDETLNGERLKPQVHTKVAGTQLMILPKIDYRDGPAHLTLTVRSQTTEQVGLSEKTLVPAFRLRRAEISSRLKSGEVLLLAEQPPPPTKKGEKRNDKRLLVVIVPELIAIAQATPAPAADPDHATKADMAATLARKLDEANAVVERLEAKRLTARKRLQAQPGIDPDALKSWNDNQLAAALDKHGSQSLAESIRNDQERLKVHELDLFTEEYRRNYQSLTRQNEDLRKQLDSLRRDLEKIGTRPTPAPGSYPAAGPESRKVEKQTAILHLEFVAAAELVKILEALVASGANLPGVVAEPRTNSLIVTGNEMELRALEALLKSLDRAEGASVNAPTVSQTQLRLLELDLREAEANYASARAELEVTEKRVARGTASEGELWKAKPKVELATIAVERAKLRLDAARKPASSSGTAPGTTAPVPASTAEPTPGR